MIQRVRRPESAVLAAGTRAPDDVVRAARNGFVVLELPTDKIVVRRISVPAQAREFLPGIVRNQVERLSPWPVDQTVYGFDAAVSQEDSAALDVRVFISSRAAVNSARDELDAIGLPPDRIVARQDGAQAVLRSPCGRASPTFRAKPSSAPVGRSACQSLPLLCSASV